jgi:hypothetical protein
MPTSYRTSGSPGLAYEQHSTEATKVKLRAWCASDEKEESWISQTDFARLWRRIIQWNHFFMAMIVNGGLVGECTDVLQQVLSGTASHCLGGVQHGAVHAQSFHRGSHHTAVLCSLLHQAPPVCGARSTLHSGQGWRGRQSIPAEHGCSRPQPCDP